jgi:hypothetical protein
LVVNPRERQEHPLQGWKIHASATMDNADSVLDTVWEYCVARGISFKFLRSPSALLARVSKYAPRGYAGKLVTIYPASDEACEKILTELGEQLDGEQSPYILSDLRWGKGPLYVRYGAFANRYTVDETGVVVDAIADPDGNLVADRRDPVFYVPPWVTLPAFLEPHLAARNAVTPGFLQPAVDMIAPSEPPALRDELVRSIVASATPDRHDRPFPGDARLFADRGRLGLNCGLHGTALSTRPRKPARRVRGPHPVARYSLVPAIPEPAVAHRRQSWMCLYINDFDEDSRQNC